MTMIVTKEIELCTSELEGSQSRVIKYINNKFEEVPEEYRASARLVVETTYSEGTEIYIEYERPETEKERRNREEEYERIKSYRRREYERLKKEFGED